MIVSRKTKPVYTNKDAITTLSLELSVFSGHIKIGSYQGVNYYMVTTKGNVICEGVVLFLQSKGIEIIQSKQKDNDIFLVPMKQIGKYLEYFGEKDRTLTLQSAYVFLYDCFSQLLSRHLSVDQFQFKGASLLINLHREDAGFLDALFKHEKFKNSVTDAKAGLDINLNFLAEFDLLELDALFAALSAKGERIVWKSDHFPLNYLSERFNRIPDPEDRCTRYLSVDITSERLNASDEPAIRIPDTHLTSKLLNHFLLMKGYPVFIFNDSVYVLRRNAMQLFPDIQESEFEREAKEFIQLQKKIIAKVCDTKALVCAHFQDTLLICMNRGKNATIGESAIGSFELKHLTLETVDLLIAYCMKLVYIRKILDMCPEYFTSKFDCRSLLVSSTYGITNNALAVLANNKVVTTDEGFHTYTIDLLDMRRATRPMLADVNTEVSIMLRQLQQKKVFKECIHQAILSESVMVNVEGLSFSLNIPAHLVQIMQPLCDVLNAQFNAEQNSYKATYLAVDQFMSSEQKQPVFAEVAARYRQQLAAEKEREQEIRIAKSAKNKKKKQQQKLKKQATLFAKTKLKELELEINNNIECLANSLNTLTSIFSSIESLCVNDITIRQLLACEDLLPHIRAYGLLMTIDDLSENRNMLTTEQTLDADTMRILDRCRQAMDQPCTLENLKEINALFALRCTRQ